MTDHHAALPDRLGEGPADAPRDLRIELVREATADVIGFKTFHAATLLY
jgi:hypothetical protein